MFKIYGRKLPPCNYCRSAKQFLDYKKREYEEYFIEDEEIAALFKRKGWRTVPQIFFDDEYIGGYRDLVEWFKHKEGTFYGRN